MSHHTTKSLQRRFPFSAKNSVGTATPQYLYKADRSPANRIGESPLPYKQIPFTPLDEKKAVSWMSAVWGADEEITAHSKNFM